MAGGDSWGNTRFLRKTDKEYTKGQVQELILGENIAEDDSLYILTQNGFWHYEDKKLSFLNFKAGITVESFNDLPDEEGNISEELVSEIENNTSKSADAAPEVTLKTLGQMGALNKTPGPSSPEDKSPTPKTKPKTVDPKTLKDFAKEMFLEHQFTKENYEENPRKFKDLILKRSEFKKAVKKLAQELPSQLTVRSLNVEQPAYKVKESKESKESKGSPNMLVTLAASAEMGSDIELMKCIDKGNTISFADELAKSMKKHELSNTRIAGFYVVAKDGTRSPFLVLHANSGGDKKEIREKEEKVIADLLLVIKEHHTSVTVLGNFHSNPYEGQDISQNFRLKMSDVSHMKALTIPREVYEKTRGGLRDAKGKKAISIFRNPQYEKTETVKAAGLMAYTVGPTVAQEEKEEVLNSRFMTFTSLPQARNVVTDPTDFQPQAPIRHHADDITYVVNAGINRSGTKGLKDARYSLPTIDAACIAADNDLMIKAANNFLTLERQLKSFVSTEEYKSLQALFAFMKGENGTKPAAPITPESIKRLVNAKEKEQNITDFLQALDAVIIQQIDVTLPDENKQNKTIKEHLAETWNKTLTEWTQAGSPLLKLHELVVRIPRDDVSNRADIPEIVFAEKNYTKDKLSLTAQCFREISSGKTAGGKYAPLKLIANAAGLEKNFGYEQYNGYDDLSNKQIGDELYFFQSWQLIENFKNKPVVMVAMDSSDNTIHEGERDEKPSEVLPALTKDLAFFIQTCERVFEEQATLEASSNDEEASQLSAVVGEDLVNKNGIPIPPTFSSPPDENLTSSHMVIQPALSVDSFPRPEVSDAAGLSAEENKPESATALEYCKRLEHNLQYVVSQRILKADTTYLTDIQLSFIKVFNEQATVILGNFPKLEDPLMDLAYDIIELFQMDYYRCNSNAEKNNFLYDEKNFNSLPEVLGSIDASLEKLCKVQCSESSILEEVQKVTHFEACRAIKAAVIVFISTVMFAGFIALTCTTPDMFSFDLLGLSLSSYSDQLALAAQIVGGVGAVISGALIPSIIRRVSEMGFFRVEQETITREVSTTNDLSKAIKDAKQLYLDAIQEEDSINIEDYRKNESSLIPQDP